MEKYCSPAPTNKKKYIEDIGKILIEENGKKKYYKTEEVKKAHKKSKWYENDFACWGMSTYSSRSDFEKHHEESGEICDYSEMKTEMLNGLSDTPISDWTEIPDLDIDASWLDFGEIFEGIFEGIGTVIGGILDNL